MPKRGVLMNEKNFGELVMSSPALVRPAAEEVASHLQNAKIQMVVAKTKRGVGKRIRARVSQGTTASEEDRTDELKSALNTVFGGKVLLQYVTKSGKRRSATQKQIDNWTRGRR